jgi:hypothetical protein
MEGLAGLTEDRILEEIATKGENQWGKILGDSVIPYDYKLKVIVRVLECNLGKGTVVLNEDGNYVIRRHSDDTPCCGAIIQAATNHGKTEVKRPDDRGMIEGQPPK